MMTGHPNRRVTRWLLPLLVIVFLTACNRHSLPRRIAAYPQPGPPAPVLSVDPSACARHTSTSCPPAPPCREGWRPAATFRAAFTVFQRLFRALVDVLIWTLVIAGPFALMAFGLVALIRSLRRQSDK